jgi:hypothetical protein
MAFIQRCNEPDGGYYLYFVQFIAYGLHSNCLSPPIALLNLSFERAKSPFASCALQSFPETEKSPGIHSRAVASALSIANHLTKYVARLCRG